jgi:hypothetical protein
VSISRYQSAHSTEGVSGVLLEVVDEALHFAAAQHPAVCNRSLYEFAAQLKYAVQGAENSINEGKSGN